MTLIVNGQPREIDADTMARLVEVLDLAEAAVATALNGTFVPKRRRRTTALQSGDRVEIVAPMQGG